jgi:serine/threonine protein kinase
VCPNSVRWSSEPYVGRVSKEARLRRVGWHWGHLERKRDMTMAGENAIGIKIGSYEIIEVLGKGTCTVSYLARNDRGNLAVVKRLNEQFAQDACVVNAFLAASDLCSRIRNRRFVTVVSSQKRSTEGVFLLRDYAPGRSLARLLREGAMDEVDVKKIAIDLCEAVRAMSSRDVVHGGIHPGNVIVNDDGHIKLTDVGTTRARLGITIDADYPIDAARFLAPEIWRNVDCDVRTDVYAIGLIVAMIEQKSCPFDAGDFERLKSQIEAGHCDPCRVLKDAIDVNPAKRYGDVKVMRARLAEMYDERAKPPSPPCAEDKPNVVADADTGTEPATRNGSEGVGAASETGPVKPESDTAAGSSVVQAETESSSAPVDSPAQLPSEVSTRAKKAVATISSILDVSTGDDLLSSGSPKSLMIPRNGSLQQRLLHVATSGRGFLDVRITCHGGGVQMSPNRLQIPPGQSCPVIVNLQPDGDEFVNVVFNWDGATVEEQALVKIYRPLSGG